jgi:hypothetical protein
LTKSARSPPYDEQVRSALVNVRDRGVVDLDLGVAELLDDLLGVHVDNEAGAQTRSAAAQNLVDSHLAFSFLRTFAAPVATKWI